MSVPHIDYPVDFDQDPGLLTFTFGGKDAVAEVPAPGTLSTSTLDAFAGRLNRPDMLPSDADLQGYLNPKPARSSFLRRIPVTHWRSISSPLFPTSISV